MVSCVFVSDFHLKDIETPEGDVLIVAGDMTMRGRSSELDWFEQWLTRQPQRHKIWVAGNHDRGFEDDPTLAPAMARRTGSIYLLDQPTEIMGLKIWGSPITPEFYNWAFMRDRGAAIRKHWDQIPEGLDILITHGPPFGYLDTVPPGTHAGCEELLDVLNNGLQSPPRYHVFGHIHEGYGRTQMITTGGSKIEMINASICDVQYRAVNPITTIAIVPLR